MTSSHTYVNKRRSETQLEQEREEQKVLRRRLLLAVEQVDDVTCVYDDVTCVYDDVTCVYDDVTCVYCLPLSRLYTYKDRHNDTYTDTYRDLV